MPLIPNVPPDYFLYSVPTLSFTASSSGFERFDSELLRHIALSDPGPAASVTLQPNPDFILQDLSSSREPASATLQPDPDLFSQDSDTKLMAIRAHFDGNMQEWQDLLGQKQDAPARGSACMASLCSKTANLLPKEGEARTMTPHTLVSPQHILSLLTTSAQLEAQPHPTYTVYDREGCKIFRCQCGHETLRKGDMARHHQSLIHASKSQTCSCGKRYTRKDSLRRHKLTCISSFLHNTPVQGCSGSPS